MRFLICISFIFCIFSKIHSDEREQKLEWQIKNLQEDLNQVKQENLNGTIGTKNPSARGCPPNIGGFVILDFLYWRSQRPTFPLAVQNQSSAAEVVGKLIRVSGEWDPGFRVGLGWNTSYDDWDLLANWTYYHNNSTETFDVPTGINDLGMILIWLPNNPDQIGFAKGRHTLNYNTIDLELGRAFFISRALSFRPHVGLKTAFLYQDFHAFFDQAPAANQLPGIFNGHNDFWGIGPRVGIHTDWHLGLGVSILGNISTALLFGKFKIRENSAQIQAAPPIIREGFENEFHDIAPHLQMLLGLSWGRCFYRNKMFFGLKLAWETNIWWAQSFLFRFDDQPDLFFKRAVTLEGITARAKLDF